MLLDYVSITLGCSSVQDTIFNGLALAFLVDLDNRLWTAACLAADPSQVLVASLGAEVEACLTSVIFTFFFSRQFLVTLYSLRTDTLPMARDMCAWKLTQDQSWMGCAIRSLLRLMSLNDQLNDRLNHLCNPSLGGYCSERFGRIQLGDMYDMIAEQPLSTVSNIVTSVIILLIPQVLQLSWALEKNPNSWIAKVRDKVCPRLVEEEEEEASDDEHQRLSQQVRS